MPAGLEPVPLILSHRGVNSITVTCVLWFLACITLVLRSVTNFWIRKRTTCADCMISAAFLIFTGHAVLTVLMCLYGGLGFHTNAIPPPYARNNFKLGLGQQTAYPLSLGLTKWSICYLLTTIFPMTRFKIAAFTIGFVCILWTIATILIGFLICQPLSFNWDPQGSDGSCSNIPGAWTSVGVFDIVFDLMILILPMPMLTKLKMRWTRKLAVGSVFTLGFFTIIVGIIRTIAVAHVDTADFTYQGYYAVTWTTLEPPTAIIVACLMTLRPLHQRVWPLIRDKLGLPLLCGDDDEYETYSYADTANEMHQGQRSNYWPSSYRPSTPPERIGVAIGHGEPFRGQSGDEQGGDDIDDGSATVRGSTVGLSSQMTPSHSMKLNSLRRSSTREISASSSVHNAEGIFAMGATPALPQENENG